jgi:2-iminobutanoate/2-iminopropanoate deaminase
MAKKIIYTPYAPEPIGPYSQAVEHLGILYVSGQIPIVPSKGAIVAAGIKDQTKQVMENLKAILEAAGYTFDQVNKCSIFITDMSLFGTVNEVYGAYFDGDNAPARETIAVSALPKGALVEISCIASK